MTISPYTFNKLIRFIFSADKEHSPVDYLYTKPKRFVDGPNKPKQTAYCASARENVDAGHWKFGVGVQERLHSWFCRIGGKSCSVWVTKVVTAVLIQWTWYVKGCPQRWLSWPKLSPHNQCDYLFNSPGTSVVGFAPFNQLYDVTYWQSVIDGVPGIDRPATSRDELSNETISSPRG